MNTDSFHAVSTSSPVHLFAIIGMQERGLMTRLKAPWSYHWALVIFIYLFIYLFIYFIIYLFMHLLIYYYYISHSIILYYTLYYISHLLLLYKSFKTLLTYRTRPPEVFCWREVFCGFAAVSPGPIYTRVWLQ